LRPKGLQCVPQGRNELRHCVRVPLTQMAVYDSDYVETIKERFSRSKERVGSGSYKTVYKGFDHDTGCECAWNQIKLDRLKSAERGRLQEEIKILSSLNHANIINFYDFHVDEEKQRIVFITELMTAGTLRQFVLKSRQPAKLKVIKRWCIQILKGLMYLHSQNIIHRDLKCDNIFINGSSGEVKIGDLGLSTVMTKTHAESVIGTPEFMAPEVYDEHYTEKVDTYAFGMCFLEMMTQEYPYSECTNAAQIYKKVTGGKPPGALLRIDDGDVRDFIELCIGPFEDRPAPSELLEHSFFSSVVPNGTETEADKLPVRVLPRGHEGSQPLPNPLQSPLHSGSNSTATSSGPGNAGIPGSAPGNGTAQGGLPQMGKQANLSSNNGVAQAQAPSGAVAAPVNGAHSAASTQGEGTPAVPTSAPPTSGATSDLPAAHVRSQDGARTIASLPDHLNAKVTVVGLDSPLITGSSPGRTRGTDSSPGNVTLERQSASGEVTFLHDDETQSVDSVVFAKLQLLIGETMKEITFPFDFTRDTPLEVASEMAENLGQLDLDSDWLAKQIEERVEELRIRVNAHGNSPEHPGQVHNSPSLFPRGQRTAAIDDIHEVVIMPVLQIPPQIQGRLSTELVSGPGIANPTMEHAPSMVTQAVGAPAPAPAQAQAQAQAQYTLISAPAEQQAEVPTAGTPAVGKEQDPSRFPVPQGLDEAPGLSSEQQLPVVSPAGSRTGAEDHVPLIHNTVSGTAAGSQQESGQVAPSAEVPPIPSDTMSPPVDGTVTTGGSAQTPQHKVTQQQAPQQQKTPQQQVPQSEAPVAAPAASVPASASATNDSQTGAADTGSQESSHPGAGTTAAQLPFLPTESAPEIVRKSSADSNLVRQEQNVGQAKSSQNLAVPAGHVVREEDFEERKIHELSEMDEEIKDLNCKISEMRITLKSLTEKRVVVFQELETWRDEQHTDNEKIREPQEPVAIGAPAAVGSKPISPAANSTGDSKAVPAAPTEAGAVGGATGAAAVPTAGGSGVPTAGGAAAAAGTSGAGAAAVPTAGATGVPTAGGPAVPTAGGSGVPTAAGGAAVAAGTSGAGTAAVPTAGATGVPTAGGPAVPTAAGGAAAAAGTSGAGTAAVPTTGGAGVPTAAAPGAVPKPKEDPAKPKDAGSCLVTEAMRKQADSFSLKKGKKKEDPPLQGLPPNGNGGVLMMNHNGGEAIVLNSSGVPVTHQWDNGTSQWDNGTSQWENGTLRSEPLRAMSETS